MSSLPSLNFNYRIIRSKRKSLGLYVKIDTIEARAPYWLRDQEILSFLKDKENWCQDRLAEQAVRNSEAPSFENNTQCLFFGETRFICHLNGKPQVIDQDKKLLVFHYEAKNNRAAQHSNYLRKWIRQEAEQYLRARCYELEAVCLPPKPIRTIQFRKTKSKWGHCTNKGEIQLNWLLIMAPPEVMDYVIIHEICHLTHMNHSKAYWQLVEKLCPNYQAHKNWLCDNGHKISL